MRFAVDSKDRATVSIMGSDSVFPIHRIFCVGRNYVAHAAEMGSQVDREAPWYFSKSAHTAVESGGTIPYAPGTSKLHYELELVVAVGKELFKGDVDSAAEVPFGYCCGLDMTRRDLQEVAKANRRPWDIAKDIENGAVLSPLMPAAEVGRIGPQRITLRQNGEIKQDATLFDMVWSVPEVISHLSHYYHLVPGDLIMTGTPAGVGSVAPGDVLEGTITGLVPLTVQIGAPD